MDRRRFLKSLFATGVITAAAPILIEEVSRVYSFPTAIVTSQPYEYMTWDTTGLHKHLITYYDKRFLANLKANTPLWSMAQTVPLPRLDKKIEMFMYIPEVVLAA